MASTSHLLLSAMTMKGRWEFNTNVLFLFMYSQKWKNYNVLSPNSYTHLSVRDLYISRIGLSILLQAAGKYVDRSWEYINRSQTHEHMNVGIGTEVAQFLFREYINSIFGSVWQAISPCCWSSGCGMIVNRPLEVGWTITTFFCCMLAMIFVIVRV